MKNKLYTMLGRIPTKIYYIAIALVIIPAYIWAREVLIDQRTWYIAIQNQLTVNLVIFFYLFGYWTEQLTKNMPKRKSWIVWAISVFILFMVLKYAGGLETWW